MNKLGLVLVLVVAGSFTTASVFAWQTRNTPTDVDGWIHEFYRDAVVDYVLLKYEELKGLQIPSSWEIRNLTAEGWCGSSTIQYVSEGWKVKVTCPVVLDPICPVEIEYSGEISFHWKGTVDQSGNVVEIDFAVVQ